MSFNPPPYKKQKVSHISSIYIQESYSRENLSNAFILLESVDNQVFQQLNFTYRTLREQFKHTQIYSEFLSNIRSEWDILFTKRVQSIILYSQSTSVFLSNSTITQMLNSPIKYSNVKPVIEGSVSKALFDLDPYIVENVLNYIDWYSLYIKSIPLRQYESLLMSSVKSTLFSHIEFSSNLIKYFYDMKIFPSMFINLYCEIASLNSISSTFISTPFNSTTNTVDRIFSISLDIFDEDLDFESDILYRFRLLTRDDHTINSSDFTLDMINYLSTSMNINVCVSVFPDITRSFDSKKAREDFRVFNIIEFDQVTIRNNDELSYLYKTVLLSLHLDRMRTLDKISRNIYLSNQRGLLE